MKNGTSVAVFKRLHSHHRIIFIPQRVSGNKEVTMGEPILSRIVLDRPYELSGVFRRDGTGQIDQKRPIQGRLSISADPLRGCLNINPSVSAS